MSKQQQQKEQAATTQADNSMSPGGGMSAADIANAQGDANLVLSRLESQPAAKVRKTSGPSIRKDGKFTIIDY